MKDKLKILIQLQACDSRISDIVGQKEKAPLRINQLKSELLTAEEKLREDADRLDLLMKERRKVEQEIQDSESKIEKSNVKLSNIKSNKEYAAALKEIEDLKTIKFQAEDKMIQLLEEIEALEKKETANKNEQLRLEKDFNNDKLQIEKEMSVLDEELQGLQDKSEKLGHAMDKEILKKYHFLRDRRDGRAVSPVIAGVCQTCHMGIPPQKFNELLKGDALMTCPYCNRMIYWAEDEHFKDVAQCV